MVANFEFLKVDSPANSEYPPQGVRVGRAQTMRIYDPRSDAYSDIKAPHQVIEKDGNIVFVRKSPEYFPNIHLNPNFSN